MSIQTGSFLGGFRGKLGPAVGYLWNGKWCLRSRPASVSNPRTPRQQECRSAFRQQVQLAAAMRDALMQGLLAQARQAGMTPYNLFMAANQDCFSMAGGVLQVDYARLRLSLGGAVPVEVTRVEWTADNVLRVRYDGHPRTPHAAHRDLVRVYLYDPESATGYLTAPAYRGDRRLAAALPDALAGRRVHLYALVQSEATGEWAGSVYIGQMTLEEGQTVENEAADELDNTDGKTAFEADRPLRSADDPNPTPRAETPDIKPYG